MNFRRLVLAVIPFLLLGGCNLIQSKEEQCLLSTRLEFKDPDSLAVVQNMGSRGQTTVAGDEFFWLRYKAKNSYGAFMSSNLACAKKDGKWARDTIREAAARNAVYVSFLGRATADLNNRTVELRRLRAERDACKNSKGCLALIQEADLTPQQDANLLSTQGDEYAKQVVNESLSDLNKPAL